MRISTGSDRCEQAIVDLFTNTFTASEGADEGAVVGSLARDLVSNSDHADIRLFRAEDAGRLIGAVIFSPLVYSRSPQRVVLLSPMAVATGYQGKGVGQTLITKALDSLKSDGVDIVITYGHPRFYGKVGFVPITEQQAPAPMPLSFPHGWLGQSLTDRMMPNLQGTAECVSAFKRADIW